jgi:hypothetical protein
MSNANQIRDTRLAKCKDARVARGRHFVEEIADSSLKS